MESSIAQKLEFSHVESLPESFSVDAYLEKEKHASVKHEYHGGQITAMAGVSRQHDLIAGNLFADLHRHLRGGPCKLYKSDVKVKIQFTKEDVFFYPDLMVSCAAEKHAYYVESPKLIVEVLSKNKNRDRFEKFALYQQLESLEEYVIISQDPTAPEVSTFLKEKQWEKQQTTSGEFRFESLDFSMSIEDLYFGVS